MDSTLSTSLGRLKVGDPGTLSEQGIRSYGAPTGVDKTFFAGKQLSQSAKGEAHANEDPSAEPQRPNTSRKQDSFRFLIDTNPTQFKDNVLMRENRKHVMRDFLRKERVKTPGKRDIRAEGPLEVEKRRHLVSDAAKAKKSRDLAAPSRMYSAGLPAPQMSADWSGASINGGAASLLALLSSNPLSVNDCLPDGTEIYIKPGEQGVREENPYSANEFEGHGSTSEPSPQRVCPLATETDSNTTEKGSSSRGVSDVLGNVQSQSHQSDELSTCVNPLQENNATPGGDAVAEQFVETTVDLSDSHQYDDESASATPESARQLHERHNPFMRRLQQLSRDIASEDDSDHSSRYGSDTDNDDAGIAKEHLDSHNGYRHHNGTSNPATKHSSHSSGIRQHTSNSTGQGSSLDARDNLRDDVDPPDGVEDGEHVRTDTRRAQNNSGCGTVILCPLGPELKCLGKDENMSSLL